MCRCLFSVALSVGLLRPGVTRHRFFRESGLSSARSLLRKVASAVAVPFRRKGHGNGPVSCAEQTSRRGHPALRASAALRADVAPIKPKPRRQIRHHGTIRSIQGSCCPRPKPHPHDVEQQIIGHVAIAKCCRISPKGRAVHHLCRRFRPHGQPLPCQAFPIKAPSGVDLAPRGHVGMSDHALRPYVEICEERCEEGVKRCHQRSGKW